jgi:phage gpG-like protein
MIPNNLRLVKKVWTKETKSLDIKARLMRDEMMAALIQLSKEQIKGKRPKVNGRYTKAVSGLPPMNRTGDLRRSITGEKFNVGFANYSAIVGPTIVYGRRVELGGGNWRPGTMFPYMAPAYAQFRTMVLPQITNKYFRRFK